VFFSVVVFFPQGPHTLPTRVDAIPAIVLFPVNCADADVALALIDSAYGPSAA
jgi:hypothetical protein